MSPRTRADTQRIREARREAIFDAARRVFARSGLAATRMQHIAAEAGVSQGLIYHYFPDKNALFTTIVEGALRETASLTARERQGQGSAWQRLERLCQVMLAGVIEYPEYPLVIVHAFTIAAPEEARKAVENNGRQALRDLVALVQEGQREGTVVTGDPVELALAFTATLQGVALSRLQAKGREAAGTPGDPGTEAHLPKAETILRLLRAGRDASEPR